MKAEIGGVFARGTTKKQTGLSLTNQIRMAKVKLESKGYIVPDDKVIAVDWTSLDLYSCPDFQKLRQWIRNGDIKALAIFDRDRLNAQGLQRFTFLAECREAGVELIICQGPPILDESGGVTLEMVLALGKESSVMRSRR